MTGITVTRRNGNLLACKTARPEDSERIRHEAQLLKRLEHPGIVQFVDFVEGHSVELYLAFVGPDSWATQPPTTPTESIEGLASAASTVADLHDLGTVHGALRPEHVLVAPDKRPVLCGLADARTSSEAGCANDLAGLAGLIDHLAVSCQDRERRQLDALARRAERGSVTAGDLTAELDRLHGGPHKLNRRRPRAADLKPSRRASLAAAALLGSAVLGWIVLKPEVSSNGTAEISTVLVDGTQTSETTTGAASSDASPAQGPAEGAPTDGEPTSTSSTEVPAVPEISAAAVVEADATTDDRGLERLIITHGGRRYGVGRSGDQAILGDWTCDGDRTLALLQANTGVIAVFTSWPAPLERLEADYVTVVEGATGLRNDPNGGCDHLRVTHPNGSTLIDMDVS